MPYITRQQVTDKLTEAKVRTALDDDKDRQEDLGLLDRLMQEASNRVDGYLESRFTVPIADPPNKVIQAALTFCCFEIVRRAGVAAKDNPFTDPMAKWEDVLTSIGAGDASLTATDTSAFAPGAAITETAALDARLS